MFRHGEGGREVLNIQDEGGERTEVRGGPPCAWDGGSIPSNQTPSYVRLNPRQRISILSPFRARPRSIRPPSAPLSILIERCSIRGCLVFYEHRVKPARDQGTADREDEENNVFVSNGAVGD